MQIHQRRRFTLGRTVLVTAAIAGALTAGLVQSGSVSAVGTVPLSTGLNADGQLGNGTTTMRLTPGPLVGIANVVAISSGREHAYALDDQGRVWAWGDNSKGAVGDGTKVDKSTPVRLSLTNVVQVEAGHYHGVALRADGTVWTWGYGTLGQLGLGTINNRTSPVQNPS